MEMHMEFLSEAPKRLDFLIARIEGLFVRHKAPDDVVAIMVISDHLGGKATIGMTSEAMQTLTEALVQHSPRTPGTPGRN